MSKRFIESGDHALFWATHGIESPLYRQCRDEALTMLRTEELKAVAPQDAIDAAMKEGAK